MTAKVAAPNQSDAEEFRNPSTKKNNLSFRNIERRFNIDQRYRLTKDYAPAEENYKFGGF